MYTRLYTPYSRSIKLYHRLITLLVLGLLIFDTDFLSNELELDPSTAIAVYNSMGVLGLVVLVAYTSSSFRKARSSGISIPNPIIVSPDEPEKPADPTPRQLGRMKILNKALFAIIGIMILGGLVSSDTNPLNLSPALLSVLDTVHSSSSLLVALGIGAHILWVLKLQIRDKLAVFKRII